MSSDSDATRPTALTAWLQLVRLPNVFTVIADVGAAFLLVSQGPQPIGRLICVVLAGISLYWAGMVLNDVFDVECDRQQRPSRPLAAGQISIGKATLAGWALLAAGVALAALSGYLPAEDSGTTWLPAAVGVVLAIMIVAYDGPLKKTPLAPAAMGSCRTLSFLLGASPGFLVGHWPFFPNYVWAIAIGFGVYIMGVTTMARQEATGGSSRVLIIGLVLTVIGSAVLAFAPQTAGDLPGWHVSSTKVFPWMIGMIAFPVVARAVRAVKDPVPARIQTTIRVGILTIIPLAASFALLGAGPVWGLLIFALAVPSVVLSARFRVT